MEVLPVSYAFHRVFYLFVRGWLLFPWNVLWVLHLPLVIRSCWFWNFLIWFDSPSSKMERGKFLFLFYMGFFLRPPIGVPINPNNNASAVLTNAPAREVLCKPSDVCVCPIDPAPISDACALPPAPIPLDTLIVSTACALGIIFVYFSISTPIMSAVGNDIIPGSYCRNTYVVLAYCSDWLGHQGKWWLMNTFNLDIVPFSSSWIACCACISDWRWIFSVILFLYLTDFLQSFIQALFFAYHFPSWYPIP